MNFPGRPFVDPRADGARYRVLLVDDEEDILTSLRMLITRGLPDVDVVPATSGPHALEALSKQRFDLVVTDFRMPEMDGLQFLQRAMTLQPNVPRVMVTAFPDLELAMRAINEQRVHRFLTKPVDASEFLRVVREEVHRARSEAMRGAALGSLEPVAG